MCAPVSSHSLLVPPGLPVVVRGAEPSVSVLLCIIEGQVSDISVL